MSAWSDWQCGAISDDDYSVTMLDYGKINSVWEGSDRVFPNGYAFGEEWGDGIDNVEEVIAWMPLPEPYKEDDDARMR